MPTRERSIDSTVLDRITLRPHWTRTVMFRRLTAALLAATAVILLVQDTAGNDRLVVVTAARDLTPGTVLADVDLAVTEWDASTVPAGTLLAVEDANGHTVTGPVRAGELLTDVRLLGSRTATAALGVDARVVPVHLADAAVTELLREGDRVDVLTVDEPVRDDGGVDATPMPRILASGATVVLVSPDSGRQGRADRVVLLALPTNDATAVAAASLVSALTVTLH